MPVLKGIEVCQQLKADEELKKIPVIAMTALSGIFSPDVFRSMKADDYLAKPFEPGELFDRIQRFLGRSNTQT